MAGRKHWTSGLWGLVLAALLYSAPGHAIDYQLDAEQSDVAFRVSVGPFRMFTSRGRFSDLHASFSIDGDDADSVALTATIVTDSFRLESFESWSDTVKNEDWFDTARYPQAVFQSQRVTRRDDASFEAEGLLTMKGETNPVVFTIAIEEGTMGEPIHFAARARVDRTRFGMTKWRAFVGKWVILEIEAVFTPVPSVPSVTGGPSPQLANNP